MEQIYSHLSKLKKKSLVNPYSTKIRVNNKPILLNWHFNLVFTNIICNLTLSPPGIRESVLNYFVKLYSIDFESSFIYILYLHLTKKLRHGIVDVLSAWIMLRANSMLLKIDLMTNWNGASLIIVYHFFCFPLPRIKLIVPCVSSSSLGILVNGKRWNSFQFSRGIWLFPYIFIICMKYLVWLI